MLPILHLNGYKIAGPTVLARASDEEVKSLLEASGYDPLFVEGDDAVHVHQTLAAAIDECYALDTPRFRVKRARTARRGDAMAGDRSTDAERMDGSARSRWLASRRHVSLAPGAARERAKQSRASRNAREMDAQLSSRKAIRRNGWLVDELAELAPRANRRMGANPHANGGTLLKAVKPPGLQRIRAAGRNAGD